MKLLHGSNMVIDRPDLSKCHSNNDFGKGFYLTPQWKRAWGMGKRRRDFYGGSIVVNTFYFYPKRSIENGLKILSFNGFTTSWAAFIIKNRHVKDFTHEYDVVVGPVADAIVDDVIKWYILRHPDDYLEETNLREFVNSVSQFGTDYVQYYFCTEKALQELIKD